MARFGSLITAMITPFDDDGRVDLEGAAALAEWLVAQGNDGLVVTGSTGEASMLTDDEQVEVWQAVRAAVDVPLIAGLGHERHPPRQRAHRPGLRPRHRRGAGRDAVLQPSAAVRPRGPLPGGGRLDRPAGAALRHPDPLRAARSATRCSCGCAHEVPNIVGLKDAAANATKTARTVADTPADFEVYAGDDAWTLPMMAVGAVGVISVAGHWAAPVMSEMIAAFDRGDHTKAWELNALLLESWDFESGDLTPNPIPAKAMMRAIGQPAGQCRLPMGPAPAGLEERALEVWNTLHG